MVRIVRLVIPNPFGNSKDMLFPNYNTTDKHVAWSLLGTKRFFKVWIDIFKHNQ